MGISYGIIGAGHLGTCLLTGLIQSGVRPDKIFISDPKKNRLDKIQLNTGVKGSVHNQEVVDKSDTILLTLRPKDMQGACEKLSFKNQVIISTAAGISTDNMKAYTKTLRVIRAMPNLATVVNASMTALYATDDMSAEDKSMCESLFRGVGETLWLTEEKQIHAFTALCGSSPAIIMSITEQLENIAHKYGFDKKISQFMVRQTLYGTGKLMLSQETSSHTLISSVCVKGGVTEAMLSKWNTEELANALELSIKQGVNKHESD